MSLTAHLLRGVLRASSHGAGAFWHLRQAEEHRLLVQNYRLLCKAQSSTISHAWQPAGMPRPRAKFHELEHRLAAVVNGLSLSNAGQKMMIGLLPLTISAQLFPGRFRALALEIAPSNPAWPAYTPQPQPLLAQLFSQVVLPPLVKQLYEELQVIIRGMFLALLFAPAVVSAPLAFWAGGAARAAWMQLVIWTLERAGPAFIKWGQWSSTRPDLFPPDLCRAMERLQSSAPSHSGAYSRSAIEKALHMPVYQIFDEFDDTPVASGSIAQIHRAKLSARAAAMTQAGHKPGTVVAVKVRHPGVTQLMTLDFELMERMTRMLSRLPGLSNLRLEESIRQFGGPLKEQLDLKVEAQHLSRFKKNFRLWPSVSFPTPIFPLVTSDVLVESFEDGSLISNYIRQPAYQHRVVLAETGLQLYLQMLLRDNFIHADLHPGNILVREVDPRAAVGGGWAGWLSSLLLRFPPKLVLLDTGMIAELSKTDQKNLMNFFRALTKQDGEQVAHAILDMSERTTCKNPDAFVAEVQHLFDSLDPEYIHRHTSRVIETIIDTIREHQVTLRSAVSTVVVTTLVLEGWSSKLHPDLRILDYLRDMLVVDWGERISRTVDKIMSREGSLAVV